MFSWCSDRGIVGVLSVHVCVWRTYNTLFVLLLKVVPSCGARVRAIRGLATRVSIVRKWGKKEQIQAEELMYSKTRLTPCVTEATSLDSLSISPLLNLLALQLQSSGWTNLADVRVANIPRRTELKLAASYRLCYRTQAWGATSHWRFLLLLTVFACQEHLKVVSINTNMSSTFVPFLVFWFFGHPLSEYIILLVLDVHLPISICTDGSDTK